MHPLLLRLKHEPQRGKLHVMLDARTQLDRQYPEMRWRILSLAADLDRLDRCKAAQTARDDPRLTALRSCVEELLSMQPHRAERVQQILSDKSAPPD